MLVLYDIWFSKFVDFEFRNAFIGLGRKIMKNEKIVIMANDNLVLIVLDLQLLVVSDCCAGSRFGKVVLDCLGENLNGYQELTRKLKEKNIKKMILLVKKLNETKIF